MASAATTDTNWVLPPLASLTAVRESAPVSLAVFDLLGRRVRVITEAERRGTSIYVLRANTVAQMETFLRDTFGLAAEEASDPFARAMQETEDAISRVLAGAEAVELAPQNSFVRRYQHELAQKANLSSDSSGKEPHRAVRIYREGQRL